jgi:hypothetical protein
MFDENIAFAEKLVSGFGEGLCPLNRSPAKRSLRLTFSLE